MTDEEIAEEWCKNNCGIWDKDCNFACNGKQGVLYGLAEGRKEKCLEQNKDGTIRPCEVMKENAELKAQVEEIQNKVKQILLDNNAEIGQLREVVGLDWCDKDYVEKLEKENAELKAENKQIIERERVVPEHYLCEMIDKYKELKEQNKTILEDNDTLNKWNDELRAKIENLEKENAELKEMFEFICKQRFGYAWNMNKDVYIADIKRALKGEKTRWG